MILDLDGTLLFGEQGPGALVIKGRRRNSYLARETLIALSSLQSTYHIYLATGRSLQSAGSISDMLSGEGIHISGIVAENGGVWVGSEGNTHYLASKTWLEATNKARSAVGGIVQEEFVTCLALLSPQPEEISQALSVYSEANLKFHLFKDGNKLFVLAGNISKKNALNHGLGVEKLGGSVGAGNDLNDMEWLKSISLPGCTGCSKEEIKKMVLEKKGLVSRAKSHAGILEILNLFTKEQIY